MKYRGTVRTRPLRELLSEILKKTKTQTELFRGIILPTYKCRGNEVITGLQEVYQGRT